MFGSWPTATKKPSASITRVSPVCVSRMRTPVTRPSSAPSTSSTTAFVTKEILSFCAGAVEHDLRGAELVAAVHDDDLAGEAGQERRLLHRRVAAAHDHDALVAEEGRVAGRAVRDAAALERLLGGQPELARARTGGHDDRVGAVLLLAHVDAQGLLREVDPGHVVGEELGAEALGLRAEVGHHLGPDDAVPVARGSSRRRS